MVETAIVRCMQGQTKALYLHNKHLDICTQMSNMEESTENTRNMSLEKYGILNWKMCRNHEGSPKGSCAESMTLLI